MGGCGQQIVDMSINKTKFAIGDNCPGKVDVAVAVVAVAVAAVVVQNLLNCLLLKNSL